MASRDHYSREALISGELMQWHKVTLTFDIPLLNESGSFPNPSLDYRMTISFIYESGSTRYEMSGSFAADGNSSET